MSASSPLMHESAGAGQYLAAICEQPEGVTGVRYGVALVDTSTASFIVSRDWLID